MNTFHRMMRQLERKLLLLNRYRTKFETAGKKIEDYLNPSQHVQSE